MNGALRERFERLLKDLPQWENEDTRVAFLGQLLRAHEVWDHLYLKGSNAVTASGLLDVCERFDSSLGVLLDGLRDSFKGDTKRSAEIDFLRTELAVPVRPRVQWKGAPYLGLNYFDREHAPIFFGRQQALRDLVAALLKEQGRCFSVVLGASGSGKSSLVRAGLWAGLEAGQIREMPGSEKWLITAMTPTDMGGPRLGLRAALELGLKQDKFRSQRDWKPILAKFGKAPIRGIGEEMFAAAAEETGWLVILDQMEELFAAEMQAEGAAFLDELIQATQPPARLRVVGTMRADFYQHCHSHPPLLRLMNRDGGTFHLGAPDKRALEEMVRGPLTEVELVDENGRAEADWYVDPDLPSMIASDAEKRPGGLALMAFGLRELYDRCKGRRRLGMDIYSSAEFGGLAGAISRKADDTLKALGPQGEKALERVFARLLRVNADDAATRRRERLSAWQSDDDGKRVIAEFQKARLLVTDREPGGEPVVEVAHEALLREWPKLRDWIGARKDAFQLAERVRIEARGWNQTQMRAGLKRPWDAEYIDRARQKLEAAGLLTALEEDAAVKLFLTPEAAWILEEIQIEETTSLRRSEIGRRLAEMGDPRPGVGLKDGLPDILWRDISGGSVNIEEHGRFEVKPFRMAAYPVTAAQFRAFVDAQDGYESGRWWNDLKREPPDEAWGRCLNNHPITHVSWYDATVFCRWLSSKTGEAIRLPDEQEWQWAAGNEGDWAYPWGAEWVAGRANTAESDINRTTAVGMFANGASGKQVFDLAGNVWEWCRNEHGEPRNTGAGESARVLRGGSWGSNLDFARAAFRYYHGPLYRYYGLGFRVVVSSPIGKAGRRGADG